MTNEELDHVNALARDLGATIVWDAGRGMSREGPYTEIAAKVVHLNPVGSEPREYWTALHELGHVADNPRATIWDQMFDTPVIRDAEARAWLWALDNALRPPDAAARGLIAFAMSSYLIGRAPGEMGSYVVRLAKLVGRNPDIEAAAYYPSFLTQAQQTWAVVADAFLPGREAVAA